MSAGVMLTQYKLGNNFKYKPLLITDNKTIKIFVKKKNVIKVIAHCVVWNCYWHASRRHRKKNPFHIQIGIEFE